MTGDAFPGLDRGQVHLLDDVRLEFRVVPAHAAVDQRDTDGRYAFVRLKVELDVTLEPAPQNVRELVAKAERDCFVGASLSAKPRYRWTVNGEELL